MSKSKQPGKPKPSPASNATKRAAAKLSVADANAGQKGASGGQGGPGSGGGMNFHSAVLAIAAVHMMRGTSTGWLEAEATAVPVAIWAETKGPGDDIRLELSSGDIAEAQVKRGLRVTDELWTTLIGLARGIADETIAYGILIVSPRSTRSVYTDLADDLRRVGQGRTDELKEITNTFLAKLKEAGLKAQDICPRLFIQAVHAVNADGEGVTSAKTSLQTLLASGESAALAWTFLYTIADDMIATRGRIDLAYLTDRLRQAFKLAATTSAAGSLAALVDWSAQKCTRFEIIGCPKAVSTATGWIPLEAQVRGEEEPAVTTLADALARYHDQSGGKGNRQVDADWIGEFYPQAVVIAGPGMGKTTLLKRIGWRNAALGRPVLIARLKQVALQMASVGTPFVDAFLQHALDGAPLGVADALALGLGNIVILADGIDECGAEKAEVLAGLAAFVAGHPKARLIVTSRPVGYSSAELASWRHYELAPLDRTHGARGLARLLDHLLPPDDARRPNLEDYAKDELDRSSDGDAIAARPQLIGLAAALLTQRSQLGATRTRLYSDLFDLFERHEYPRYGGPKLSDAHLSFVLDTIGWEIVFNPVRRVRDILDAVAGHLAAASGKPKLAAREIAELCCDYWEAAGLIEQLHAAGTSMLTFTHQTFAEYAAARHLKGRAGDSRKAGLAYGIATSGWGEVLGFAASMGLADEIIGLQISSAEPGDPAGIIASLKVLGDPDAKISGDVRSRLIETAASSIERLPRDAALNLGAALADAARAEPGPVATVARHLLAAEKPWVQLIGWTALGECGGDFPIDDFIAAATGYAEGFARSFNWSLLGGLRLGETSSRDLLQRATPVAIELSLKAQTLEEAAVRFKPLLALDAFDNVGFTQKLGRLFPDGRELKQFKNFDKMILPNFKFAPEEFKRANRAAGIAFLNAIRDATDDIVEQAKSPEGGPFGQLSALLAAARHGESIPREVYAFERGFDAAGLAEVFKGVIALLPIDQARLRAEALAALPIVKADEGSVYWQLDLPQVDIPDPDWDEASRLELDDKKLIAALSLQSSWIIPMAAELLRARKSISIEAQKKLLAEQTGYGLAAAAYMTSENAGGEAVDMLIDTIATRQTSGLRHVIQSLAEMDAPWSEKLRDAVRPILLGTDARLAEAAATLVLRRIEAGDEVDAALLEEAFVYWLKTEEPYPKGGGIVPASPRAELLRGLVAAGQRDMPALIAHLRDDRSDVTSAASKAIKRKLAEGEGVDAVTDAILAKTIGPALSRDILATTRALRPHAERLRLLASDEAAAYRLASMPLFTGDYGLADAKVILERLTKDDHPEVATAARQALKDLAG